MPVFFILSIALPERNKAEVHRSRSFFIHKCPFLTIIATNSIQNTALKKRNLQNEYNRLHEFIKNSYLCIVFFMVLDLR